MSRDPGLNQEQQSTLRPAIKIDKQDKRTRVKDTSLYPFASIAYLEVEFASDGNIYCGTAFLADKNILVTAAHNIRDDKNRPAKVVKAYFGINGIGKRENTKKIKINGEDFIVPASYKTPNDANDIAWMDLNKFHHRKMQGHSSSEWSLDDLPRKQFVICDNA